MEKLEDVGGRGGGGPKKCVFMGEERKKEGEEHNTPIFIICSGTCYIRGTLMDIST